MAITKQYLKSKPEVCKVTFAVEAPEAKSVVVVGDFNAWKPKATVLKKQKNGTFKGTAEIKKDATYQFKYLVDGAYVNEAGADGFAWNDFAGAENSVLAV